MTKNIIWSCSGQYKSNWSPIEVYNSTSNFLHSLYSTIPIEIHALLFNDMEYSILQYIPCNSHYIYNSELSLKCIIEVIVLSLHCKVSLIEGIYTPRTVNGDNTTHNTRI